MTNVLAVIWHRIPLPKVYFPSAVTSIFQPQHRSGIPRTTACHLTQLRIFSSIPALQSHPLFVERLTKQAVDNFANHSIEFLSCSDASSVGGGISTILPSIGSA
jgi:hypothetical protein